MASSETFGVEEGMGPEVVRWMNERSRESGARLEARLYGRTISTANFGRFELFSWMGDPQAARRLLTRASKRFRVRVIEGGYKPKETVFRTKKYDYAMVKRGEKTIGRLEFEAPRLGRGDWTLRGEERR
ncbi:MAG: hypothetical protein MPI95_07185 [Nitrosopumilus sp.]|nr:hypothetical protein [Nitrosopumilus sp.]MDA7958849.1 hypothetical protein [Nitrosopumilus sp.]